MNIRTFNISSAGNKRDPTQEHGDPLDENKHGTI